MKVEVFLPVVDQVHVALTQRHSAYKRICTEFLFLLEMASNNEEKVLAGAKKLIDNYKDDCIRPVHSSSFWISFLKSRAKISEQILASSSTKNSAQSISKKSANSLQQKCLFI